MHEHRCSIRWLENWVGDTGGEGTGGAQRQQGKSGHCRHPGRIGGGVDEDGSRLGHILKVEEESVWGGGTPESSPKQLEDQSSASEEAEASRQVFG